MRFAFIYVTKQHFSLIEVTLFYKRVNYTGNSLWKIEFPWRIINKRSIYFLKVKQLNLPIAIDFSLRNTQCIPSFLCTYSSKLVIRSRKYWMEHVEKFQGLSCPFSTLVYHDIMYWSSLLHWLLQPSWDAFRLKQKL